MNRLRKQYIEIIAPRLVKQLKIVNVMELPRLSKIVVNAGIGPFRENREAVESFVSDLASFTGQKPSPRKARLSVAGFKVRQNDVVGYTVNLRGEKMWAFLDKFINISLPRVRDFRGLSALSFDRLGNYSIGVKEHVIFPEVNPNTTKGIRSLQITIAVSNSSPEKTRVLLKELGVPFRQEDK